MERVSKEWLEEEIKYLNGRVSVRGENSPDYSNLFYALTELLERRENEDNFYRTFVWECPHCGTENVWTWPTEDWENWVSCKMVCDICEKETTIHDQPKLYRP